MGLQFWTIVVALTLLFSLSVSVFKVVVSADQDLVQNLGLEVLPDVSKINISQEEYSRMMKTYLVHLVDSSGENSIPQLLTFVAERKHWRRKIDQGIRLTFAVTPSSAEVEQGELRLLLPPMEKTSPRIQVFQILGVRRRKLIHEGIAYGSSTQPKWHEIDVTAAVRSWINGNRNLGLEIECSDCTKIVNPLHTYLNVLVHTDLKRRRRSHSSTYEQEGKTDCRPKDKKRRCCRHSMTVVFSKLKVPQINSIIQPKSYEAGFCKGRCPLNYNLATNHSRIQSLVHRVDKSNVPKVCCAPSKLAPLDILRVNPYDVTKLTVEKWDNMKVLECACS
ncbi:bone morphogenetic protein 4 [Agrilus planipennis]|uniref:Bone morphogenetic protein 4 n=1 Tax=Agrilus planipennis TaxID=224129 RepID=A0A1W4X4F3_AGRPL|nr:bone morphogenetic protein 4 [Agrilus planipennis]